MPDVRLNRFVALKVLLPKKVATRSAGRLGGKSPNIVTRLTRPPAEFSGRYRPGALTDRGKLVSRASPAFPSAASCSSTSPRTGRNRVATKNTATEPLEFFPHLDTGRTGDSILRISVAGSDPAHEKPKVSPVSQRRLSRSSPNARGTPDKGVDERKLWFFLLRFAMRKWATKILLGTRRESDFVSDCSASFG
jgi:hypothetical protein